MSFDLVFKLVHIISKEEKNGNLGLQLTHQSSYNSSPLSTALLPVASITRDQPTRLRKY